MARIRTIKPTFFTSEDIIPLSPMARLLFIGLWCEADRLGRLAWRPTTFRLRYLPTDTCDIHALTAELVERRLVVLYGDGLAYIPTFERHQYINPREPKSDLPAPSETTDEVAADTRHCRVTDAHVGRKEGRKEGRDAHAPEPPAQPSAPLVGRRRLDLIHESAIGVDVSEAMHRTYLARLANLGIADADRVLCAFYHATEQEWRGKDTGKAWPFWDARVDELVKKRPNRHVPFAWTCKTCGEVHEATRERAQSGWCPKAGVA
jgi:hypothetical protein